tara:strand:+ start:92 stop:958 length:867 start_codon:yes stop_codon:yes gene_type:complete
LSYIGVPPQATFSSGLLDRFTSTTGTTVTLTHDIASENDIVVFVNFVKQDSTTYSVGGTGNKTLTLGGTLVSSDIVEVHYLNIVGQTVNPSANSVGSSQLTADSITGQTAETSIATDDTVLIHDTSAGALRKMTRANFVSGVGGNNTPAFRVKLSGNQSMSAGSHTKIQFNTEDFDTDNAYDNSSNYRFTPQTAGKYFIYLGVFYDHSSGTPNLYNTSIYKNGSSFEGTYHGSLSGSIGHYASSITVNTIVTLNGSSDYVEAYGRQSGTGTPVMTTGSFFGGYKLIGV